MYAFEENALPQSRYLTPWRVAGPRGLGLAKISVGMQEILGGRKICAPSTQRYQLNKYYTS